MSDKLESFIQNHRDQFDTQVPSNQVWANIQTGIAQQAAGAAGTTAAGSAAKAGLAKVALGWKIAIVAAVTAAVGTGIFLAINPTHPQDGNGPEKMATTPNPAPNQTTTTQAEYLYEGSPVVTPPLPGVNIPYAGFTVNADTGGKWMAPSGTVLKVGPGTFVDALGNPVKGDVQIKYREFHDAADILLSGITMEYTEHGAKENFQTAGMMEILGSQGEAPVYIAPGKHIDVRMASFTTGDDYNLYFLDPRKGWKDIGKPKTEANKDLGIQRERTGTLSAPRPPIKGESGVEQDGEVMFTVNYEDFPELRPFKEVRWMAEDKGKYAQLEDKILSKVWTKVELHELDDDGLRYQLTLWRKGKAEITVNMRPILEGEDYEMGMERFRKKKAAYDKMIQEKELEEERLATQADVFRSFPIAGFGIYNCDRFYLAPDVVNFRVEFVFPEGIYMDPNKTIAAHITGDNRAVILMETGAEHLLRFSKREKNTLVVILPNHKVAVFGQEGFRKLSTEPRNGVAKLPFETKDIEIHSAADLRLVLGV